MTLGYTFDGLQIDTFDEIYERRAEKYREIYGNDINLDPDSPDGQRLGIESQAELDVQTELLSLYNQLDPSIASGENLNKRIKFSAIERKPATQSSVDVVINATKALTLPADYTVKDALGQSWYLQSSLALSIGDNTVTLLAENFGEVSADIDTVTIPETIILGINSVTNEAIAVEGEDEENDSELRKRRSRSVAKPSRSILGGLEARLRNLAGVTDAKVYENDDNVDDVVTGIPANSFWCIVEGGLISDIVEVIAKQRTGGSGTKGEETESYIETIQLDNDDTLTINHEMSFDRPTETPIYINLTATRTDPSVAVPADEIKDAIAAREFEIGEDCHAGRLYQFAYAASGSFFLSDLEISDDDSTFTDERIVSALAGKFTISTDNITITEVTP